MPTADQRRRTGSQERRYRVHGGPQQPLLVACGVDEWEAAVDQISHDWDGRFVQGEVDDRLDASVEDAAEVTGIAGVAKPERVIG
jgi:hypothetical protein